MPEINPSVQSMSALHIEGNIIPASWYNHLRYPKSGKPYLIAITLLAEIVYWFRPRDTRDPDTGEFLGFAQKFAGDALRRSYNDLANLFGFTKREASEAVKYLVAEGLITTELRTIDGPSGERTPNVLFFTGVSVERLHDITYRARRNGLPSRPKLPSSTDGVSRRNVGGCSVSTGEGLTSQRNTIYNKEKEIMKESSRDTISTTSNQTIVPEPDASVGMVFPSADKLDRWIRKTFKLVSYPKGTSSDVMEAADAAVRLLEKKLTERGEDLDKFLYRRYFCNPNRQAKVRDHACPLTLLATWISYAIDDMEKDEAKATLEVQKAEEVKPKSIFTSGQSTFDPYAEDRRIWQEGYDRRCAEAEARRIAEGGAIKEKPKPMTPEERQALEARLQAKYDELQRQQQEEKEANIARLKKYKTGENDWGFLTDATN